MGMFFSNILIENRGDLRGSIEKALVQMGYVPAEDGEFTLDVYGAQDDRFWTITGDAFGGDLPELAKHLAKADKCRAIVAACLDSDVLLLQLTKGKGLSTVCIGYPEAYDIEPEPFRPAPWKELLGEDRWTEFKAITTQEYVFQEEAMLLLSELLGFNYDDAIRQTEFPENPVMTLAFKRKEEIPLYLPDDLPPAFRKSTASFYANSLAANPIQATFASAGGLGKGCIIYIAANKFDAAACKITSLGLQWDSIAPDDQTECHHEQVLEPKPISFTDGRKGWMIELPNLEILPGVNLDNPFFTTYNGASFQAIREFELILIIEGASFPEPPRACDCPDFEKIFSGPTVDLHMIPVENPKGAGHIHIAVTQFNPNAPHQHIPDFLKKAAEDS